MNDKLGKNAKLLLLSDSIYSTTGIFVNTFLVAYLLQITNDSTYHISIFYIISYLMIVIGFRIFGRLIKIKPKYNIRLLNIGIILRAIFILFIALLKEAIIKYFYLITIFYSIAEILYWIAHETLYIDVTTNDNRKNYMAYSTMLTKIVGIIVPIILGVSIDLYSFSKIAFYVLLISIVQIIAAFLIKNTSLPNKQQLEKYNIKNFKHSLNLKQKTKINKYYISGIFYGIIESSTRTLVTVLTVITFKTSFNLGILTSIFSICSMIILYLYKKSYTKDNSKYILYACSTLILMGVTGVIIDINKLTLIIYNLFYTVASAILTSVYNTQKGNLIKECNIEKWKIEYITYLEQFIVLGRIIGFILILISGLFNNILVIKLLLIIVSIFAPLYTKLASEIEKQ